MYSQADFLAKRKPKFNTQLDAGDRDRVPFAIILGGDELKQGLVRVKEQRWEMRDGEKKKIESADKGELVKRAELIEWLQSSAPYLEWKTGNWI